MHKEARRHPRWVGALAMLLTLAGCGQHEAATDAGAGAAGAVVSPGKVVGEGELWVGNPARLVRTLNSKQIESLHYSADHYVRLKDEYL